MKTLIYGLLLLLLFNGCSETAKLPKKKIAVSILPQKFFVEQIVGNNFEVTPMVRPGMSPSTYEPLPKQLMELKETELFFRIGVPFEDVWIKRIAETNPQMKIIDTREGLKLRKVEANEESEHANHQHKSGEYDPHIWLSTSLVKKQCQTILNSLIQLDKTNENLYTENYNNFMSALDSVTFEIEQQFQNVSNKNFIVFHPAWGYFADQFGLQQYPIELEGKEPSPAELRRIIRFAKQERITTIFVQKQFSSTAAEAIAKEIDGKVIKIDPLSEDYLDNLMEIAKALSENK